MIYVISELNKEKSITNQELTLGDRYFVKE